MSDELRSANQSVVVLEEGKPFILCYSSDFWQVREGTVDVYSVTGPSNDRHRQAYLFSASQGQPLFALPFCNDDEIRLMAISPHGAELKIMNRDKLLAIAAKGGEHLFEVIWFMVEEWVDLLLSGLGQTAPPRVFSLLKHGRTISLDTGQIARTGREVLWIKQESGEVRNGRLPEYRLQQNELIPLVFQAWLIARTEARLTALTTEEAFPAAQAIDEKRFWDPLDDCHRFVSAFIQQYFADEVRRDHLRLAEKKRQRDNLMRDAISHLSRHDMPATARLTAGGVNVPPLLAAMREIAGQLGVDAEKIRLPGGNPSQHSLRVETIARQAGLQSRRIKLETGWQNQDNGPLLAFVGDQLAPVALLPKTLNHYRIFFPADQRYAELTAQDLVGIQPIAYTFYAGLYASSVSLYKWLKFSLKGVWPSDYWTLALASTVGALIPLLTPFVTETLFSDLIPIQDRQGHIMVIQVMMTAAIAGAGVSLTRGVALMRLKYRSRLVGEAAIWLRLLSLPATFFRKYESGDLAQRMNGVSLIHSALSNSALAAVFSGVLSLFSLLQMIYYNWKLGLATFGFLIAYFCAIMLIVWRMTQNKRSMMLATGKVAGRVLQILNGLSKFRLQGAEAQAFYLWAREFGEEWKWNRKVRWNTNWLEMINVLQPILMTILIFGLTMHWLEKEAAENAVFITQTEFLSFSAAMGCFNAASTGMISVLTQMMDIVPLLERLKPVLAAQPEVADQKLEADELTGQIEVHNLTFRYSAERSPVLKNISLKILPGQFAAIVGASGSGKTTLLRLLLGFEQPENGAVYYDGQDLAELNKRSVRSQMGVVLQNGQLMAGDIFTNIVGSLPLTHDDAWKAAEMAGLAEDIREMPMGMHTIISEGAGNISGGQRQRILIARAIVHRPRIILFDEATSALDNRTQSIVTESLDRLKATRVIVAHRLSTIIKADIIFVLENGRMVENGNFSELMQQNGVFAALAKRQIV